MKKYLLLIVLIASNLYAQTPIEEFNKVMEAYNLEYTTATTDVQRKAVDVKYEAIITKAESTLEKALEAQIKAEEDKLKAEQEASANELKKLESEVEPIDKVKPSIVLEWETYISKSTNVSYLNGQFKESELIEIGKYYGFEWTTKGTKKAKIELLLKK